MVTKNHFRKFRREIESDTPRSSKTCYCSGSFLVLFCLSLFILTTETKCNPRRFPEFSEKIWSAADVLLARVMRQRRRDILQASRRRRLTAPSAAGSSRSGDWSHIFIKSINHGPTKARCMWCAISHLSPPLRSERECGAPRRQWSPSRPWWTSAHKTDEWVMAPSQMALRSPVYHFYYSHLHFHISYLHFLCRYKSESLWLIRPLCAGPGDGITAYRTLGAPLGASAPGAAAENPRYDERTRRGRRRYVSTGLNGVRRRGSAGSGLKGN